MGGASIEKRNTMLTAEHVVTPSGTAATGIPEQPGRVAWAIKASSANTGIIYFRFGGTASATVGTPLTAGQGYAEPVAGNAVWDGAVSIFCAAGADTAVIWSY